MFCGMQSTQMPALCDLYMYLHTFVVRMETEKSHTQTLTILLHTV